MNIHGEAGLHEPPKRCNVWGGGPQARAWFVPLDLDTWLRLTMSASMSTA